MRRRLILSTLGVAVFVVTVFALPLGFAETAWIQQRAEGDVRAEAQRILSAVENRWAQTRDVSPAFVQSLVRKDAYAVVEGSHIQVPITVDMFGGPARRVPLPTGLSQQIQVGAVVNRADTFVYTLDHRATGFSITVMLPREHVHSDIWRSWLLIGGGATLAVVAAAGLAWVLAARLTRPLLELADCAELLGAGDLRRQQHRYGLPELDRVANVLDESAVRISRMLAAERQFAANASHQLRTPLTALSMRVEEMAQAEDLDAVKEEAGIALNQIERLTGVVTDLLDDSRGRENASAVRLPLDSAVKQQAEEWRLPFAQVDRSVVVNGRAGLVVSATPGRLAQSLAVLLENALTHGAGTVTISTRAAGRKAIIEVADEGQGIPESVASRLFERSVSGNRSTGLGLGLSLARQLVEADGGRLEVTQYIPPVFAIFLPRVFDDLNGAPKQTAGGRVSTLRTTAGSSTRGSRSGAVAGSAGRAGQGQSARSGRPGKPASD
jgi:signal transduction histidine kinase